MAITVRIVQCTLNNGTVRIRYNAGEGNQNGPWTGQEVEFQHSALSEFVTLAESFLAEPINAIALILAEDITLANPSSFNNNQLTIDIRGQGGRGISSQRGQA